VISNDPSGCSGEQDRWADKIGIIATGVGHDGIARAGGRDRALLAARMGNQNAGAFRPLESRHDRSRGELRRCHGRSNHSHRTKSCTNQYQGNSWLTDGSTQETQGRKRWTLRQLEGVVNHSIAGANTVWRGKCSVSGKAMARAGLRMMPTFPLPSLKFRTAGFPPYGFKAGLSDAAFPARWFAIALRALCCHRDSLLCVRDDAPVSTSARAGCSALPQGPSLRSGLFCPGPSSLRRPHPPHSQAHPDFTAWRLIRDAFAVHTRICL
jgi:hypothetical protein